MDFVEINFTVPNYSMQRHPTWRAWAPELIESEQWFCDFKERVIASVGRDYLPVVRLADGEFSFLFGSLDANPRWPFYMRWRYQLLEFYRRKILRENFCFRTRATVSSASYTLEEWEHSRAEYSDALVWIAERGVLAPQLAYLGRPTMEQFQTKFIEWVKNVGVQIDLRNLTQFYFVYALLLSVNRPEIVDGNRVLVVHGATGVRKENIISSLKARGASNVGWLQISNDRSLFDKIDYTKFCGRFDVALVGAGVGKPMIIRQLEPLSIPVIDIGYVFEVWLDEACRHTRPFCSSDAFFDAEKAKIHPTLRYILENQ